MTPLAISAFDIAQRFIGTTEVAGSLDNPQIMAMLKLDMEWPQNDEVPWCSAFANYVAWLLRLPRSKDLRARSWLRVGRGIQLGEAEVGFDVAVLKRGSGNQPGPTVIDAPGHVGFYAGHSASYIEICGGNQADAVNVKHYKRSRLLGMRRLVG